MRFAASIRYGGQLIEALDVDYEDYKRLGLICPECKSAVFLRNKSERATAHFAHFKASDPALVKQCELRVSSYSKEDLERKATQARNQRLKLLQRWFWEVYFKYAFREGSIKRMVGETHILEQIKLEHPVDEYVEYFRAHVNKNDVNHAIDNSILTTKPEDLLSERVRGIREKIANSEIELHKLICAEVIEFLKTKRNSPLLEKVMACSFFQIQFSPTGQAQMAAGRWNVPLANLAVVISMIPWAEEFQELDKAKIGS